MHLVIHRGTNEIGASCVEVQSGQTRLLLDLGLPVDGGPATLPGDVENIDGVLISHSHPDHHGLLELLPNHIPVLAGAVTTRLIQASRVFGGTRPLACSFHAIETWKPIKLGDCIITPYLADHSAPDAFGFLVSGDGKRLFYSGDFRAHGRKASLVRATLYQLPRPVDVLLVEGTLVARGNTVYPDEKSVEAAMLKEMRRETNLVYLLSSAQNLDRLVSIYRAAKKAGRVLVIDLYTAWILEEIGRSIKSTPRMAWEDVRVLAHGWPAARQYSTIKQNGVYFDGFLSQIYKPGIAIDLEEIGRSPGRFVLKSNYAPRLVEHFGLASSTVIYSMWEGYMRPDRNPVQAKRIAELRARQDVVFEVIHTSGHATLDTLRKFVQSLDPGRVVPIHTEHKGRYPDHFDNVTILEDGECLVV